MFFFWQTKANKKSEETNMLYIGNADNYCLDWSITDQLKSCRLSAITD